MRALLLAVLTCAGPALAEEAVEPSLAITDLTVGEGLTREAILKGVHPRWEALEACYAEARREHPTLGGQWNATYTMQKRKGIVGVKVNYASVNLDSLEACYEQSLVGLVFEDDKKAAGTFTMSLTASPGTVPASAYEAASRYAGGTAELGEVAVQGGLDAGAVTNGVRERLHFLRGCFSESLQRRTSKGALVVLQLRTVQGGDLESVELLRSDLRDDTAERCMVAMAQKVEVETAEDAGPGVATVPVTLGVVE